MQCPLRVTDPRSDGRLESRVESAKFLFDEFAPGAL